MLAGNRIVRLAGLEIPGRRPDRADDVAAKSALVALVGEKGVLLKHMTPTADRHGQMPALAFLVINGSEHSLQEALLAAGHARVGPGFGTVACAAHFLAVEQRARLAKLGLWADPYYEIRKADDPASVLKERGRFALVEGKVISVRSSAATIYLNFGRRWSTDFTVTVSKRSESIFAADGMAPKNLVDRWVRVRGIVEERGGPWIEAIKPEQIETIAVR
ncbi:MAG: thermonuclease family protein [Proteobacteria bacterium]|nr:thermonuclease family protein [Pseudomonadota bacterium]